MERKMAAVRVKREEGSRTGWWTWRTFPLRASGPRGPADLQVAMRCAVYIGFVQLLTMATSSKHLPRL